jgi:hypothetical protein
MLPRISRVPGVIFGNRRFDIGELKKVEFDRSRLLVEAAGREIAETVSRGKDEFCFNHTTFEHLCPPFLDGQNPQVTISDDHTQAEALAVIEQSAEKRSFD